MKKEIKAKNNEQTMTYIYIYVYVDYWILWNNFYAKHFFL